jgi:hypothetical protein
VRMESGKGKGNSMSSVIYTAIRCSNAAEDKDDSADDSSSASSLSGHAFWPFSEIDLHLGDRADTIHHHADASFIGFGTSIKDIKGCISWWTVHGRLVDSNMPSASRSGMSDAQHRRRRLEGKKARRLGESSVYLPYRSDRVSTHTCERD